MLNPLVEYLRNIIFELQNIHSTVNNIHTVVCIAIDNIYSTLFILKFIYERRISIMCRITSHRLTVTSISDFVFEKEYLGSDHV